MLHGGLRGFEVGLCRVQLGLRAHALIEQLLLAPGIGLGVDQLRAGLIQIALRGAHVVLLIGRVEAGQNIAFFNQRANVVIAPHDAARHAKAQGAFVAGFDVAGKAPQVLGQVGLGHHVEHGPDGWLRRLFFRAAQQQYGRERRYP